MKIISNFKDYYDATQAFYMHGDVGNVMSSPDVRYERTTEHLEISSRNKPDNLSHPLYQELRNLTNGCNTVHTMELRQAIEKRYHNKDFIPIRAVIACCGKVYIAYIIANVTLGITSKFNFIENIFWSKEEFYDYFGAKCPKTINRPWVLNYQIPKEVSIELHRALNAPVFFICCNVFYDVNVITNPKLVSLRFQQVVNPYLAYQEIEMFLPLMYPKEEPPNISDKDRIIQHGFDKQSFRKQKSK